MPHIVVAIPNGPLSIFPRLTPMHGCQTEHKGMRWNWTKQLDQVFKPKFRPQLEPVFLWCIMVEAGRQFQTFKRWNEEVAFRRMQIARRRIAAQGPFRFSRFLPRGQGECQLEKPRQSSCSKRLR